RRGDRRHSVRGRAARPPGAAAVCVPRPQPDPAAAAGRAADGRLGEDAPAEAGNALSVQLSKLRRGLGADRLRGRTEIELLLPANTFVDTEAALEGAHRAETCIAQQRWAQAWGPAGIAYHVATRPFLVGLEAAWVDEWRRRLAEGRLRGLECFAAAGLGLGGPALAQAEER